MSSALAAWELAGDSLGEGRTREGSPAALATGGGGEGRCRTGGSKRAPPLPGDDPKASEGAREEEGG